MKPIIGKTVIYNDSAAKKQQAAIITAVHSDDIIDIVVITGVGVVTPRLTITRGTGPDQWQLAYEGNPEIPSP